MTPPTLSRVFFAPAYQELVLLAAALVESSKVPSNPNEPKASRAHFRQLDKNSDSLRATVGRLKEDAFESLGEPHKQWCGEANEVIDWCFEVVMRVCFSESWLPVGSLANQEVRDEYRDRLLELSSGRTRRGSPPQGLLDLYLACMPIIYHSDEPGAQQLRSKIARSKERPRPLTLPRPAPKDPSTVLPLIRWRWVTMLLLGGLGVLWLTFYAAWHSTETRLLGTLPDPGSQPAAVLPAAAPAATPTTQAAHH